MRAAHRGLTLVEMLVSVTITLLVVFAIVQVFDLLGETMAKGRATIEMAGNLRTVANRLQTDLDNLTCPVEPWIDPAAGQGYFKCIEGFSTVNVLDQTDPERLSDRVAIQSGDSSLGDTDDLLMFTARSDERPYTGRIYNGTATFESNVAEVIWWVTQTSPGGPLQLHRRALLIRPDLNDDPNLNVVDGYVLGDGTKAIKPAQLRDFLNANDLSVRVETTPTGKPVGLVANTLGDLTTPRNRFGHFPLSSNFSSPPVDEFGNVSPAGNFELDPRYINPLFNNVPHEYHLVLASWPNIIDRRGDDVMLSDVLAFDVKVYSPNAPLYVDLTTDVALAPHEPGYDFNDVSIDLGNGVELPRGTFVDLNYAAHANTLTDAVKFIHVDPLADWPKPPIHDTTGAMGPYVSYDTWSLLLERDGMDQNPVGGSTLPDEGFDGLDNPDFGSGAPENGVDDYNERETRPPYNVPLTGIEVKIRTIEFGTRQVRQVSVVGDFTD